MTARASLLRLAEKHSLATQHSKQALAEAAAWARDPGFDDPSLVDMDPVPFVTVDGASTRDLDQALHVEPTPDGWRVRYALADAAWFVRPGTALWDEALERGASYYLPGLSIPMLPRTLSEDLISLGPEQVRRAMVMDITLDGDGRVQGSTIVRARIRSRAKLSFETVQSFLDGDTPAPVDDDVGASLRALRAVGELRMQRAAERHVVRFRRAELQTRLSGPKGRRFVALTEVRRPVELYNEQLSLLCNTEGARFLQDAEPADGVQAIYRVHPPPPHDRCERFADTLAGLAHAHGVDERVWTWRPRSKRTLAAFLAELPEDRLARAIHRQAVMLNYRSMFDPVPAEHFGVGAAVYSRFSAPMREIVGVFVHKEAWERLGGTGDDDEADEARRLKVVEAANRAKSVQSKLDKAANLLVLDQLFRDDPGPHRGTVVGLTPRRAYVVLDDPPIDVKVGLRDLPTPVRVDDLGVTISARDTGDVVAHLGDPVALRVLGRDKGRGWWRMSLTRATGPT